MVLWLRSRLRAAVAVMVVAVVAGACRDLFGPSRYAQPELAGFDLSALPVLPSGSVLTIVGHPADTSFRLQYGQRVHVEIAVSNGDRESADLYREWCPVRDGGPRYPCFNFTVMTGDSLPVWNLATGLARVGARMLVGGVCGGGGCWFSPDLAEVVVLSPDDLIPVAKMTAATRGVLLVDVVDGVACGLDISPCAPLPLWDLERPVFVDSGAVVPHDGTIQARTGDTVVVSYAQPGGGTVTGRLVAP